MALVGEIDTRREAGWAAGVFPPHYPPIWGSTLLKWIKPIITAGPSIIGVTTPDAAPLLGEMFGMVDQSFTSLAPIPDGPLKGISAKQRGGGLSAWLYCNQPRTLSAKGGVEGIEAQPIAGRNGRSWYNNVNMRSWVIVTWMGWDCQGESGKDPQIGGRGYDRF